MKRYLLSILIATIIIFLACICFAESKSTNICDFDVLGLKLGMTPKVFANQAKKVFPELSFGIMEKNTKPNKEYIYSYAKGLKTSNTDLIGYVAGSQYGNGIYYIVYNKLIPKVDLAIFIPRFINDVNAKYGKPSKSIIGNDYYKACYGPHCDKLLVKDLYLPLCVGKYPNTPCSSPVKGCHLFVSYRTSKISFQFFDGTPDYKFKEEYVKKQKDDAKKVKVKF